MADLHAMIEAMTPEHRATALAVLDALTRPLTPREIEGSLKLHGVARSRAVIIASSIKRLNVIAVIGPERG